MSACTPRPGIGRPTCQTCRRPIWSSSASAAGKCRAYGVQEARKRGTNVLTIADIEKIGLEKTAEIALELAWKDADAVYISFDVDSIDCGFVPGTGWPEPGGFLPREALKILRVWSPLRACAGWRWWKSRRLTTPPTSPRWLACAWWSRHWARWLRTASSAVTSR